MAEGRRIGLLGWILIGFVVGVPFGIFFKDASISLSWMGDLFLRLLKMLIVPLVFFSLVTGTASISDPVKLGRVGVKIMVLYLATTAIAVTIGLIVALILNPAAGMKLAPVSGFKAPTVPALKEVLLNLIPTNPFDSLAKGDILPVIVFAMFFGIAAARSGDKGKAVVGAVDAAAEAMYKLATHHHVVCAPRRLLPHRHHGCEARATGSPALYQSDPRLLPGVHPSRGCHLHLHPFSSKLARVEC